MNRQRLLAEMKQKHSREPSFVKPEKCSEFFLCLAANEQGFMQVGN